MAAGGIASGHLNNMLHMSMKNIWGVLKGYGNDIKKFTKFLIEFDSSFRKILQNFKVYFM